MRSPKQMLIFLLLLVTFSFFVQGGGHNQNSTIAEIREVVEHGKFDIGSWVPITNDISVYNWKAFTNKSPNMLFFVAPLYFIFFNAARILGFNTFGLAYNYLATHFITILCAGMWGALTGVFIHKILNIRAKFLKPYQRDLLAIFCCLSTLVLPYSTVAFVHSFETFWCVYAIYRLCMYETDTSSKNLLYFSLAMGMMVLGNPTLAPVLVAGGIIAISLRKRVSSVFIALIGIAVPLLPLLVYNYINFDSIIRTNRHFQLAEFVDRSLFMGVFHRPYFSAFCDVFVYSNRSLAPSMIWLYFSFYGLYLMTRQKMFEVTTHIFAGSIFFVYVLFMTTFNNPHGGACYGPRYMVPALLIMALYTAPVIARLPRLFWVPTLFGYGIQMMVTSTCLFIDYKQPNPLSRVVLPLFFKQHKISGFPSFLAPPYDSVGYKYSLGDLLGMGGFLSILLLIGVQVAIGYSILKGEDTV